MRKVGWTAFLPGGRCGSMEWVRHQAAARAVLKKRVGARGCFSPDAARARTTARLELFLAAAPQVGPFGGG